MAKLLNNSYLYNKFPEYEKVLFEFLVKGNPIDKDSDECDDIRYEIKKRQISNALIKVFDSPNVILMIAPKPLPKQFKVFVAKDIKSPDKKHKIFIDCTDLVYMSDGQYTCRKIDILIAYLIQAMTSLVYYTDEKRFLNNNSLTIAGAECFAKLFTAIIDYICKISVSGNTKSRCLYLSSMYYLESILGKNSNENERTSLRIAGLSERESDVIGLYINDHSFDNIKIFIETINNVLKVDVTLDTVVDKWMYLYGTGTVLGMELFPCFSAMITDAYVGCFINNQKTIENQCKRSMVTYTKTLLMVGEGSL